jgi:hypothetical protein
VGFVFSLASEFCIRGAGVAGRCFGFALGVLAVHALPLCGAARTLSATAGWFASALRWHPRYAFVLQASPLCGAAPTFLCRRKEK